MDFKFINLRKYHHLQALEDHVKYKCIGAFSFTLEEPDWCSIQAN